MPNDSKLSNLDDRLEAETPSKMHHNSVCFEDAYLVIEKHLKRKIPLKRILENFNSAYDLNISPARFRQLLEAERKRHDVSEAQERMGGDLEKEVA